MNIFKILSGIIRRAASRLKNSHLIITIERVMIIIAAFALLLDLSDRSAQRVNQAWEIVALDTPGNSGKIEALEFLNSHSCFRTLPWNWWGSNCDPTSFKKRIALIGLDVDNSEYNEHGTYLVGIKIPEADLKHANLGNTNMAGADLQKADLKGVLLGGANLEGANLTEANLRGADLQGANLKGANLALSDLKGAYLTTADLRDVKNLKCDQLTLALNWEGSYRLLSCDEPIPVFPTEDTLLDDIHTMYNNM